MKMVHGVSGESRVASVDPSAEDLLTRFLKVLPNGELVVTDLGGIKSSGVPGTVVPGSAWQSTDSPAGNTQAVFVAPAPGANRRIVCSALHFSFSSGALAVPGAGVLGEVLDGAARIWSGRVSAPAALGDSRDVTGEVVLVGSENTAMTFRFTAAGGVNTFESVSANGYVVEV